MKRNKFIFIPLGIFTDRAIYFACVNSLFIFLMILWRPVISWPIFTIFSARCNIYISHLCYDVSVRLSVRLSVTFVYCGHRVQRIPDIFACLDRWMSLLLTDNASPRSSDGMLPGFLVEKGRGMEKLVIVAISLNLLTESLDWKQLTVPFRLHMNDVDIYLIS